MPSMLHVHSEKLKTNKFAGGNKIFLIKINKVVVEIETQVPGSNPARDMDINSQLSRFTQLGGLVSCGRRSH